MQDAFLRKKRLAPTKRLQEVFRASFERYIGKPPFPSHCTLLTELHNDATTEYTIINRPKQKPPPLPPERKIYRSRVAEILGRSGRMPRGKKMERNGFGQCY